MLDLEVTPKIFAPRSLLEVKMLQSEPRALVTELSLYVGISKPASGGSGPHTGREVVTHHPARVCRTRSWPCSLACHGVGTTDIKTQTLRQGGRSKTD